jgi:hypothetical protein
MTPEEKQKVLELCENDFVKEIIDKDIQGVLEILNWYHNLYHKEELNTERGVMALTINSLFMKYDIKPKLRASWINSYPNIEPNPMFMYGICSNCGFEQSISDKLKYCPGCGAEMYDAKDLDIILKTEASNLKFLEETEELVKKYNISRDTAHCYICNFEDDYICNRLNRGCNNVELCRQINKKQLEEGTF